MIVTLRSLFVASILLASNVAAADRIKVAVVPGVAVNLDAARVDALSQDLAEGLSSALDVDAVGGLEVRRQLPADGVAPDCATNPSCTADVAKRTGAQQLLFVVMVDSGAGGAVQVDTTWVEPATGHSASRPPIDLTSTIDSDAKSKFEAAATRLLPDAPVKKKAGEGTTMIMQPAMRTEARTGTHQRSTRYPLLEQEREDLAIEEIVTGAGVFVEVDCDLLGRAGEQHS